MIEITLISPKIIEWIALISLSLVIYVSFVVLMMQFGLLPNYINPPIDSFKILKKRDASLYVEQKQTTSSTELRPSKNIKEALGANLFDENNNLLISETNKHHPLLSYNFKEEAG